MKNSIKAATTIGILGIGVGIWKNRKNKQEKETTTEAINQLGLVNVDDSYYSITEINAQSGDLELTATEAQSAIRANDKTGQIVALSVKQIKQTVPTIASF